MTRKKALQILIRHAAQDCKGAGTGIRSIPSKKDKSLVKEAITKLWKEAYNWNLSESDFFNLGL